MSARASPRPSGAVSDEPAKATTPAGSGGVDQALLSLATLAGRRRKEAQEALLEKIAGLLGDGSASSVKERTLIDEILVDLVKDVEQAVRARLAEQIAGLDVPPQRLLRWLIEDEIDVARPLILRSPALADEDLLAVCARSHGHRLVAAERPGLDMPVSECLVARGEADVALTLLRNETARLSQKAFARIIAKLGEDPAIAAALTERPDLSEALAHQLFWAVAGPLRRTILSRFKIRPEAIDGVLDGLAAEGYAGLKPAFDEVAMLGRDRLAKFGPISQSLGYLRAGNLPDFARDVARRLEISPQTIRRVLNDPGGEAIAVISRALDLDRSQFTSLCLLMDYRRRGEARPIGQVEHVANLFGALDREEALGSLRLWDRVDLVAVD